MMFVLLCQSEEQIQGNEGRDEMETTPDTP